MGDTPVPARGITSGELSVLFTKVRLPEMMLAEAGAKLTVKNHPIGGNIFTVELPATRTPGH